MSSAQLTRLPPSILLRMLKKADTASTLHKLFFACKWMHGLLEKNKMALTHLVGHVKLDDNDLYITIDFLDCEEREMLSQLERSEKIEMLKGLYASLRYCGSYKSTWSSLIKLSESCNKQQVAFDRVTIPQFQQEDEARSVLKVLRPKTLIVDGKEYRRSVDTYHQPDDTPWFSINDDLVIYENPNLGALVRSEEILKIKSVCITACGYEPLYDYLDDLFYNFDQREDPPQLRNFELFCKHQRIEKKEALKWIEKWTERADHTERDGKCYPGTFTLQRNILFFCRNPEFFVVHQYSDIAENEKLFYRMSVLENLEDVEKWKNMVHYMFLPEAIEKIANIIKQKILTGEKDEERNKCGREKKVEVLFRFSN